MKKYIFGLAICGIVALFSSCEEDNPTSQLPEFSEITFDVDKLYAGDTVTATAVQSKKGNLLYNANYTWTLVKNASDSITASAKNVVYDDQNSNPQWKFGVPNASSMTIKLTATYYPSCSTIAKATNSYNNGTTVTYIISATQGIAKLTKSVKIYQQP